MSIKNYHYNYKDIKGMKELIRTGRPLLQIAREEHERYGATLAGFYAKLQKLAKTTTKIRKWEGPKKTRRTEAEIAATTPKVAATQDAGIAVPEGTTFEGVPKKVVIYKDHFRIYF
jgi:hypothetical protein